MTPLAQALDQLGPVGRRKLRLALARAGVMPHLIDRFTRAKGIPHRGSGGRSQLHSSGRSGSFGRRRTEGRGRIGGPAVSSLGGWAGLGALTGLDSVCYHKLGRYVFQR